MGRSESNRGEGEGKGQGKHGETEKQAPARYYGQVEGVEGQTLWMGGKAFQVSSYLVPYLAPGMVVEVEGGKIRVLYPTIWAYYQGPGNPVGLGQGPVRVWLTEGGVLWRALPGNTSEAVLVARYLKGTWQAVPRGFSLPQPPMKGWWLLVLEGSTAKLERWLQAGD